MGVLSGGGGTAGSSLSLLLIISKRPVSRVDALKGDADERVPVSLIHRERPSTVPAGYRHDEPPNLVA
jgi:hypothetical protein